MGESVRDRIMARVVVDEECGCWVWQGVPTTGGYGQTRVDGRLVGVHRVMYEADVGPIPKGMTIDHVRERGCRYRVCVNPAHLEPVTMGENARRGGNAIKTHCARGHKYDEANTYRRRDGGRGCRACRNDAMVQYRQRLLAATV